MLALENRLTRDQIPTSLLTPQTKKHLLEKETDEVIARVMEVIDIYDL